MYHSMGLISGARNSKNKTTLTMMERKTDYNITKKNDEDDDDTNDDQADDRVVGGGRRWSRGFNDTTTTIAEQRRPRPSSGSAHDYKFYRRAIVVGVVGLMGISVSLLLVCSLCLAPTTTMTTTTTSAVATAHQLEALSSSSSSRRTAALPSSDDEDNKDLTPRERRRRESAAAAIADVTFGGAAETATTTTSSSRPRRQQRRRLLQPQWRGVTGKRSDAAKNLGTIDGRNRQQELPNTDKWEALKKRAVERKQKILQLRKQRQQERLQQQQQGRTPFLNGGSTADARNDGAAVADVHRSFANKLKPWNGAGGGGDSSSTWFEKTKRGRRRRNRGALGGDARGYVGRRGGPAPRGGGGALGGGRGALAGGRGALGGGRGDAFGGGRGGMMMGKYRYETAYGGITDYPPQSRIKKTPFADADVLQRSRNRRNDISSDDSDWPYMDPLRWDGSSSAAAAMATVPKLDETPVVDYLGVLIDGGRHYFRLDWLRRLIDILSLMRFNLIHLRLTDDQAFHVLLDSHPELAYPAVLQNNNTLQTNRTVWTANELRDLTKYAKQRGIAIMPEINIPGHGGAWAAGANGELTLHCLNFICGKGYGVPLNIEHPQFKSIFIDVVKEVLDIFDDPPFLHLGGDEVNMGAPCFDELNAEMFDYQAFERNLKKWLAGEIKYPEERVVRWEMTGQAQLERAGVIEQFWDGIPGLRHNATGPFFISTWLYFDTCQEHNAADIYTNTQKHLHGMHGQYPKAIIGGTFELSEEFWYDRNVLGRLLAMAMGAYRNYTYDGMDHEELVLKRWTKLCNQLKWGKRTCSTAGGPVISQSAYAAKHAAGWNVWRNDICERYAQQVETHSFRRMAPPLVQAPLPLTSSQSDGDGGRVVPYTGVIFDTAASPVDRTVLLGHIKHTLSKLGFNLIQLRLVDNHVFLYESPTFHGFTTVLRSTKQKGRPFRRIKGPGGRETYERNKDYIDDASHTYTADDLSSLVQAAAKFGMQIMPEIAVSTSAGGWFASKYVQDCPRQYCRGPRDGSIPAAVHHEQYLPSLLTILMELRAAVGEGTFFHLGSDERRDSRPCFQEAGTSNATAASSSMNNNDDILAQFETKLRATLEIMDFDMDNIVRWENRERVRYPDRAGRITQYRDDHDQEGDGSDGAAIATDLANSQEGAPFFVSVNILDHSAWEVYQRTRKIIVERKPLAILANVHRLRADEWDEYQIPQRLLAFDMAVSLSIEEQSLDNFQGFAQAFTKRCVALLSDHDDKDDRDADGEDDDGENKEDAAQAAAQEKKKKNPCLVPPPKPTSKVPYRPLTREYRSESCRQKAHLEVPRLSKKVVEPFFNSSDKIAALHEE